MFPRFVRFACLFAITAAVAQNAGATSIQFNNQSLFVSQTGASLHAMPNNIVQVQHFNSGDGLTFQQGTSACGLYTHGPNFVDHLPWNSLALCGVENYDVKITNGAKFAFGLNVYQPGLTSECNAVCVHGQFSVTMRSGGAQVATFTIDPPDSQIQFFGFWLSSSFDTVEVRDLSNNIDNEFFGTFYTGLTQYTAPEPSSILLFGSAGAGLAGIVRRKVRR